MSAVIDCEDPGIALVGTGCEVVLCMDAAELINKKVRAVSVPSWRLFHAHPASYKEVLLPETVLKTSVQAAATMGWQEWADARVGINCFGASACGAPAWRSSASARPTWSAARCGASPARRSHSPPTQVRSDAPNTLRYQ